VTGRSYHHGDLRAAVIAAAVEEVEAVGAARMSMREISRRAGVSHAAPAHHFGDKGGIFTAIAIEGFGKITDWIAPIAAGPDGFMSGGIAYVAFALQHRGYFEVMFRPDLYRGDDPALVAARDAAFAVLYGSAEAALAEPDEEATTALVMAGWSVAHGLATLWLNANLQDKLIGDPESLADLLGTGLITLGDLARASRTVSPGRSPSSSRAAAGRRNRSTRR
jgi:AcrR family transcriptional regulator